MRRHGPLHLMLGTFFLSATYEHNTIESFAARRCKGGDIFLV
jgi:hypothetical protein